MNVKTKARLAVLTGNFFFGTIIVAVKHISPSLIQPLGLTAIRITITALLFWLMYAVRPVKMSFTKKDYLRLCFCALTGITLNQTFSILGISLTSPIHASLLVLTTPITITLLAAFYLKESLNFFKIAGLLLGISGGALLVFARDVSSAAGAQQSLGDLFVILGALGYSSYVIAVKPLTEQHKATHVLQWVFLFGIFFSLPLGWNALQQAYWQSFDALSWFALAYVVVGGTFIAYMLMNYGINKLGASVTGSFIYTQPFFATIASMIILNESLSMPKVLAAALIMTGVFLTNYRKK